ncbi:MAG: hypothetical protein ING69_10620 [Rhodocyclaceae bacterium]|nr:hypothetical protein [Rhodocyclaceae bacterium]
MKNLNQIAANLTETTQKAMRAALKAGGLPIGKNLEALATRHAEIVKIRNKKALKRGKPNSSTIHTRLAAKRRKSAIETLKSCMRTGASAGTEYDIAFGVEPAEVDYKCHTTNVWNFYGGGYKKYPASQDNHVVRLPLDWMSRVKKKGLAEIDGLMTLDASLVETVDGVEIFAAKWAVQGRGFSVNVEAGFIARGRRENGEKVHFHGKTRKSAVLGVARKMQAEDLYETAFRAQQETVETFCSRFDGLDFEVSLADARATGSCDYGIRSWCHAVGLNIADGSASIARVLEAFRQRPQREARLAILRASRNAKPAAVAAPAELVAA